MRIVHTFIKYPPAPGGHERYVQELVEGLRRRGHDARVLTSDLRAHAVPRPRRSLAERLLRRAPADHEVLDAPYPLVNGVPVTRLPTRRPPGRRVVIPGLRDALIAARPDLIHAHDIWRHPFEVSVDVARELGVPLFVNPLYHERTAERHAARWARELRRVAAKLPGDARVFFNTRWEEERLRALGIRFERTDYLPPSIDFEEFATIPDRTPGGLPEDRLLVTFVGRLTPAKGVDLLLDGFAQALRLAGSAAGRAHLVLAGFRDADTDYASEAARRGLAGRVSVLVDRPRAEIVNLLRRSSIFALPSRSETFGIVVIEAWATGNLVLVSDREALPYVVRDGHDGLVCSDDAWGRTLARAISEYGKPWAREMVREGERTVRREHRREARLERLAGYVDEVLAPSADS